MSEILALQAPFDTTEQLIFDRLLQVKDSLLQLTQDNKSTYVKSEDVLCLYDQVIAQVNLLKTLRKEHGKPLEQKKCSYSFWNRCQSDDASMHVPPNIELLLKKAILADKVLEDCFQLISLFYLTIGRNKEAPAVLV